MLQYIVVGRFFKSQIMITIIILAYIANIFLNRWLNKLMYYKNNYYDAYVFFWFLSIACTIAFLICIISDTKFKSNWFNGKYW